MSLPRRGEPHEMKMGWFGPTDAGGKSQGLIAKVVHTSDSDDRVVGLAGPQRAAVRRICWANRKIAN
jgi:hypothetical protein